MQKREGRRPRRRRRSRRIRRSGGRRASFQFLADLYPCSHSFREGTHGRGIRGRNLSGARCRHFVGQGPARRWTPAGRRRSFGRAGGFEAAPAMERAERRRLGRGRRGCGRRHPASRGASLRCPFRHRAFRTDAWRDLPRRQRKSAAARHSVERRAKFCRMRRTRAARAGFPQEGRQSRHARLHRPEGDVGCEARACCVRRDPAHPAAERLRAPQTVRRSRLGNVGRGRHPVARHRQARLERRIIGRDGPRPFAHAEACRRF